MDQSLLILFLLFCGLASTCGALWIMARFSGGKSSAPQGCVLLLRGERLGDCTPQGAALMQSLPEGGSDRSRLLRHLGPRFGDMADLSRIESAGMLRFHGENGALLVAEDLGEGVLRLTISENDAGGEFCNLSLHAQKKELDDLREAVDRAPMLSWREDAQGAIAWANAAYLAQADQSGEEVGHWPLPRLFDLPPIKDGAGFSPRRARLPWPENGQWFDCHAIATDKGRLCFALPADAAVRAERSLREFVQTLTKTFADLPIGLAIFDRHRNLQLFNPALIDLTGLATGFLTARPTLYAFLDRLREARMAPDPKDYRSWRDQMASLEAAASTGHHVETWSLPGGQTYRVTGRPHPDGAVAFLFEDITSEIAVTRQFRAELALASRVMDAIDDAVVVFGPNGEVELSNQAYRHLWKTAPEALQSSLRQWQPQSGGAGWDALNALLDAEGAREEGEGVMTGPEGQLLLWRVKPLSRGGRMVSFAQPVGARDQRPPESPVPAHAEPLLAAQ